MMLKRKKNLEKRGLAKKPLILGKLKLTGKGKTHLAHLRYLELARAVERRGTREYSPAARSKINRLLAYLHNPSTPPQHILQMAIDVFEAHLHWARNETEFFQKALEKWDAFEARRHKDSENYFVLNPREKTCMLDWLAKLQHYEISTNRLLGGLSTAYRFYLEGVYSKKQLEALHAMLLKRVYLIAPKLRP
ncbi:MAG: hypothetical protein HY393_02550 [Candidatus Diapherotrites archaeon]|nr:hypothetical protein [Candidatus Diapherotrites archaeon]